jgi:hypothetical protein
MLGSIVEKFKLLGGVFCLRDELEMLCEFLLWLLRIDFVMLAWEVFKVDVCLELT